MSFPDTWLKRLLASPDFRGIVKVVLDATLAILAWECTVLLNPKGHFFLEDALLWGLLALVTSLVLRLPRQHYRFIGFRDLRRLLFGGVLLVVLGGLLRTIRHDHLLDLGDWVMAGLLSMLFWIGLRALVRFLGELKVTRAPAAGLKRTLVVGAGHAGVLVVDELKHHPELGYEVVGFVDDDPSKQGLWVHGVLVMGPQEQLPFLVRDERIERAILAIPSASGRAVRQLTENLRALGVQVKTVPGVYTLLGTENWRPELRDISIEDLLRREPVTLDQEGLRAAIEDRVVLVTGAGGSIGSELARQVCRFRPSRLVLLGRGENSLWLIERELRETFPGQPLALELGDIRNRHRLDQIFSRWKPDAVIHAAAHKHVPFLELHPEEAVENNIFGTRNVLEVAVHHRVAHFVNISTDKAVNPTNVLGVSKRIAEYLVLDTTGRLPANARYVSVRFGNVLGSRGSVVPIFQEQIRKGGPVTVTHPDMTRYFMTIPEAAQLALQAGLLGETGKVYVLDMGEPVKIADLARDMIRLSGLQPGQDIDLTFTGARPGEKLFEELFYGQTQTPSPVHPKVYEAQGESHAIQPLQHALDELKHAQLRPATERLASFLRVFQDLVPDYQPAPNGLKKVAEKRTIPLVLK